MMGRDIANACIVRLGTSVKSSYQVIAGRENFPVSYISLSNVAFYSLWVKQQEVISNPIERQAEEDFLNPSYALKCNVIYYQLINSIENMPVLVLLSCDDQEDKSCFNAETIAKAGLVIGALFLSPGMTEEAAGLGETRLEGHPQNSNVIITSLSPIRRVDTQVTTTYEQVPTMQPMNRISPALSSGERLKDNSSSFMMPKGILKKEGIFGSSTVALTSGHNSPTSPIHFNNSENYLLDILPPKINFFEVVTDSQKQKRVSFIEREEGPFPSVIAAEKKQKIQSQKSAEKKLLRDYTRELQKIVTGIEIEIDDLSKNHPEFHHKAVTIYSDAYSKLSECIKKLDLLLDKNFSSQSKQVSKLLADFTISSLKNTYKMLYEKNLEERLHADCNELLKRSEDETKKDDSQQPPVFLSREEQSSSLPLQTLDSQKLQPIEGKLSELKFTTIKDFTYIIKKLQEEKINLSKKTDKNSTFPEAVCQKSEISLAADTIEEEQRAIANILTISRIVVENHDELINMLEFFFKFAQSSKQWQHDRLKKYNILERKNTDVSKPMEASANYKKKTMDNIRTQPQQNCYLTQQELALYQLNREAQREYVNSATQNLIPTLSGYMNGIALIPGTDEHQNILRTHIEVIRSRYQKLLNSLQQSDEQFNDAVAAALITLNHAANDQTKIQQIIEATHAQQALNNQNRAVAAPAPEVILTPTDYSEEIESTPSVREESNKNDSVNYQETSTINHPDEFDQWFNDQVLDNHTNQSSSSSSSESIIQHSSNTESDHTNPFVITTHSEEGSSLVEQSGSEASIG
ncbi:MAG: hypothetical protein ACH346_02040 [Chthoniobacterales bacterium]